MTKNKTIDDTLFEPRKSFSLFPPERLIRSPIIDTTRKSKSRLYSCIRLMCVIIALSLTAGIYIPNAEANSSKVRKVSTKRKARRKLAKKRVSKKMSYKKVLFWWKSGISTTKIVARARKAHYVVSENDIRKLIENGVSEILTANLQKLDATAKSKKRFAQRTIKTKTINSDHETGVAGVSPPAEMPSWTASKPAPAKKILERELRPSPVFMVAKSERTRRKAKRHIVYKSIVASSDS